MDKYLLILFYSASGAVKNLAHALADGAEELNLDVKIRTVPRVSPNNESSEPIIPEKGEIFCSKEELINCSGLALGSPTRFGSMAAPLKYFLDTTGDIWTSNSLEGVPGCAFTSTGSMHGGQELTLMNLLTYQLHQGMLVVGSPYSIKELNKTEAGGTPYGPSHVESFNSSSNITPDEYKIAFETGKRIAKIIQKLNA